MWIFVFLFLVNLNLVNFKLAAVIEVSPAKILTAKATVPKTDPAKTVAPDSAKVIPVLAPVATKIIPPKVVIPAPIEHKTTTVPTKTVTPVPAKTISPAPNKIIAPKVPAKKHPVAPVKTKTLVGQSKLAAGTHDFMVTSTAAVVPILCPVTQITAAGCLVAGTITEAAGTCCSGLSTGGTVGKCMSVGVCHNELGACKSIADCPCEAAACYGANTGIDQESPGYCTTSSTRCYKASDCPAPTPYCAGIGLKTCISVAGEVCANNFECLSNNCLNYTCAAQTNGDPCNSNCTYVAGANGSCIKGQWSCVVTGAACVNSWDCCNIQESCLANLTCGICAATKATCKKDQDCCSGNCDITGKNPACAAGQSCCTCLSIGAACTTNQTCCPLTTGNVCVSGKCAPCINNSAKCVVDTDCCSNNCQDSKCVAQLAGKICDNNSGCGSGTCTNNFCQISPIGDSCLVNSDCSSDICTLDKYCACVMENNQCQQDSNCCGNLSCVNGSCSCLTVGQTCVSSNQCCEGNGTGSGGTAHLACSVVGNSKTCQPIANCPENLGLDLAQIQSFFMGQVGNSSVPTQCTVAYELLIYNYTIFAQYATLVSNGTIACTGAANPEFQAMLTKLTDTIYYNLVVLQASCLTMNPIGNGYSSKNPPFNSFSVTVPVDKINQAYANNLATAATVINSLQPNQAAISQIAATNYAPALQWGNFANTNCGSGITSCCQPGTSSTSCICEADISNNNPIASCISAACCVGDVSLDLASNADTMIVVTEPALSAANAAVISPNANPNANYLVVPAPASTIVKANSLSLINADGTINPINIYALTADRFLSLVNCWLATLPANCPQ